MRPKILGDLLMVGLILLGHPLLAQMAQEPKAPPAPGQRRGRPDGQAVNLALP
jgi:hypothetical protein